MSLPLPRSILFLLFFSSVSHPARQHPRLVITALFMMLSNASAANSLSKQRPPESVFCGEFNVSLVACSHLVKAAFRLTAAPTAYAITSILGQTIAHVATMAFVVAVASESPGAAEQARDLTGE